MLVNVWLHQSQALLENAGIGTARLDSLVLLEDTLGLDRGQLLAQPELTVSPAKQAQLKKLLRRRANHEPLAYVRGHTEFYGRDFVITPAVLVPRPESEVMIELLGQLSANGDLTIKTLDSAAERYYDVKLADIGTGSGALGITAKLEFPEAIKIHIDLLDIDPRALEVAKMNVDKHTTKVNLIKSDLLAQSSRDYDVLLCNLPYVPDSNTINQAARHEPTIAIFGGADGLEVYRKLFSQITRLTKHPLFILTEAFPSQHTALARLALKAGYTVIKGEGFIQVFRLISK